MKKIATILLFSCFIMLVACQHQSEVISTSEIIEQTRIVVVTATPEPTVEIGCDGETTTEFVKLTLNMDEDGKDTHRIFPNLWTQISSEKFTVYPSNILMDYAFDRNGNLWMAGEFGIIYHKLDGTITHYTMKNGLPINAFRVIAVAPDGQVWAGGESNMLVRFDGEIWQDEGKNLPLPYDTRKQFANDFTYIVDMDFDNEGNIWVLNVKYELFTQVYGQWINFVFPKQIPPWFNAGMFADGLRVYSVDDIYIGRPGCCGGSESSYHYDGISWESSDDYDPIEENSELRHTQYAQMSLMELTGLDPDVWPRKVSNITYPPEKIISLVSEISQDWFDYTYQFNNPPTEQFLHGWSSIDGNIIYKSDVEELVYHIEYDLQPIEFIKSDLQGNGILANDTTVTIIAGDDTYTIYEMLRQDAKPIVMIEEYHMPSYRDEYHPRYEYSGFNFDDFYHDVHHTAKLLHFMEDGSLLFATDHLLAQWKDEEWRSFYFDTVTFDSVTVDDEGYIWVYAGVNGFLRFSPDIFDDYVDYWAQDSD